MRGLSDAEAEALAWLMGPTDPHKTNTPRGAMIYAGITGLIERGCAYGSEALGEWWFVPTELGRLAWRIHLASREAAR